MQKSFKHLHILSDRCISFILSHFVLSFCYMWAHQKERAIFILIFVHLFYRVLSRISIFETNKPVVIKGVVTVSMVNLSRNNLTEFTEDFFKFLFIDSLWYTLNKDIIRKLFIFFILDTLFLFVDENLQIFFVETLSIQFF